MQFISFFFFFFFLLALFSFLIFYVVYWLLLLSNILEGEEISTTSRHREDTCESVEAWRSLAREHAKSAW